MYVCMYVYLYVCMYACMYACLFVCLFICMFICMYDVSVCFADLLDSDGTRSPPNVTMSGSIQDGSPMYATPRHPRAFV
jgi:hypothetical protein